MADTTKVPTWSGFLYLAVVDDAWGRAEGCVDCEWPTQDSSKKIDRIESQLELKGTRDEEQKERLLEIANRYPSSPTPQSA